MKISMIAAIGQNRSLGKDASMLWHLPRDLRHFKKSTMGHFVIQGRKTYEAFGKALPGRQNVIVTRNKNYKANDSQIVTSLEEALELARLNQDDEVFIIGGAEIYRLGLKYAHRIYLTKIDHAFEGANVFFPELDDKQWNIKEQHFFPSDEKNSWDMTIVIYEKK